MIAIQMMDGSLDEYMDAWIFRYIFRFMDGCLDEKMDG